MSDTTVKFTQDDEKEIRDLLLGRSIVAVEQGEFDTGDSWYTARGRLTLDDGTSILVVPNDGCGGCSAGNYSLDHLAASGGAITDVQLAAESTPDKWGEGPTSYRIYVIAEGLIVNALQVDGDDGNGYYGTGYQLFVVKP